jgi:hypothetical protein
MDVRERWMRLLRLVLTLMGVCLALVLWDMHKGGDLILDLVVWFGFISFPVAVFVITPQPRMFERVMTRHPVANSVLAMLCPGISTLVVYIGIETHFLDFLFNKGRFSLLPVALPFVIGAFCGRAAFRAIGAPVIIQVVGVLGVIVCLPIALFILGVTFIGIQPLP